jgi:hypothetical protein
MRRCRPAAAKSSNDRPFLEAVHFSVHNITGQAKAAV